jgi:hypothetical protein
MSVITQDGNIQILNKVDKFIEIEFNKANKSGLVCFVQVARDSGF